MIGSPGVGFDDDFYDVKGTNKTSVLLRNVVKVEDVEDPVATGKHPLIMAGSFMCMFTHHAHLQSRR